MGLLVWESFYASPLELCRTSKSGPDNHGYFQGNSGLFSAFSQNTDNFGPLTVKIGLGPGLMNPVDKDQIQLYIRLSMFGKSVSRQR